MSEVLVISNVILWIIVIGLLLIVLALARQVGILHERVAPAGALMPTNGPKVGELTEAMPIRDLAGNMITIGGADADRRITLVLFVSPTCPICKSLVPTAKALAASEKVRLVFASDGDDLAQHQTYAADLGLNEHAYVVSEALGMHYQVSKLPFALLIGADGSLKSKGLVNSREHLESLFEAMESGIATLQEFVSEANDEYEHPVKEKAS